MQRNSYRRMPCVMRDDTGSGINSNHDNGIGNSRSGGDGAGNTIYEECHDGELHTGR